VECHARLTSFIFGSRSPCFSSTPSTLLLLCSPFTHEQVGSTYASATFIQAYAFVLFAFDIDPIYWFLGIGLTIVVTVFSAPILCLQAPRACS